MAGPRPEEVIRGVYRVRTGRGITGANVYLVRSGPGWVLINTAWPNRGQIICAVAESLSGTGTRPAAILLTHIHPDHADLALELARMWGPPVHVHPGELPAASGRYLPEYGNPLDRRVEASLSRTSLVGTARAFDPRAGVPGLPDWQCPHAGSRAGSRRVLPQPRPGADHRRRGVDRELELGARPAGRQTPGVRPPLHLDLELASGDGVRRRARQA
jgi:hypothetical protein